MIQKIIQEKKIKIANMPPIKFGDKVSIHYSIELEDGTIYYSSKKDKKDPVTFILGKSGEIDARVEKEITDMKIGEQRTISFSSEEGYGAKTVGSTYHEGAIDDITIEDYMNSWLIGEETRSVDRALYYRLVIDRLLYWSIGSISQIGPIRYEIKGINGNDVTMHTKNIFAPFYGKKIKKGLVGSGQYGSILTILEIGPEFSSVKVEQKYTITGTNETGKYAILKNNHPLAGSLKYHIEIIDIIPSPILSSTTLSLEEILHMHEILSPKNNLNDNDINILSAGYIDIDNCTVCTESYRSAHINTGLSYSSYNYKYKLYASQSESLIPHIAQCIREYDGASYYLYVEEILRNNIHSDNEGYKIAEKMGYTEDALQICMKEQKNQKILTQYKKEAKKFGITSGTVFVNTLTGEYRVIDGNPVEDQFHNAVQSLGLYR